jgi:hypothetical protein
MPFGILVLPADSHWIGQLRVHGGRLPAFAGSSLNYWTSSAKTSFKKIAQSQYHDRTAPGVGGRMHCALAAASIYTNAAWAAGKYRDS